MSALTRALSRLRGFKNNTEGTASVEFVLWMPLLLLLMMMTADISVLFTSQSNYWSVSRDTARLVARHAMDETAAKAYAEARAGGLWTAPTASVTITPSTVTVNLSAPTNSLSIFRTLGLANTIEATVTQTMEPT